MPHARPCLALLLVAACHGPAGGATTLDTGTADASATTTTTTASTTAEPDTSTGATGTAAGSTCGDGVVDPGEDCDDGNDAEDDACTTICTVPTCADARKDGDESDVDCGGICGPCPDDSTCNGPEDCASGVCKGTCAGIYKSCLDLHGWHPELPDGVYELDPDGDGVTVQLFCDMTNGGWTEVAHDTFDAPMGWSAGTVSSCGALSDHLLGGAGQFGAGAATEKTFPLLGVSHLKVRVVADVIIIDSWETESMIAEIDGQGVASAVCSQGIPGSCGIMDPQCGAPQYKEGSLRMVGMRDHQVDSATLRFSSTLDQDASDEAWGLDTISLQVK